MKKAIVIGGTSGIGQGIVESLIKNNYKVGVTGIEQNLLTKLQKAYPKNIKTKYLDCIKDDNSKRINELATSLGGLDLLIFSAGIGNLNKNLGHKIENHANQLNVLAFTEIADWSYRFFKNQNKGHFVAISSIAGLSGYREAPAYHAAKSYQINYLQGLRQKAKKSKSPIYITDIRPGFVDTQMSKGKKRFWVAPIKKAVDQTYNLIQKKKGIGYVSKRWQLIAIVLKVLPNWIHKRI